ncbi:MAG: formylmethanofuran dehydrogenase [Chloroflexi bacterium]|nr:formylmethanofuran dehydrogenase [Chloroflexota bacterium]MBI3762933.1 formylmethanofuran dehydrogenase [Chloroflexota bacterium]
MIPLAELLAASATLHRHLCPRQVLGVRMGMLAGRLLGLDLPQADTQPGGPSAGKRLLTIVETDGCASDGIAVATNCWVGRRTMRVKDFGKVAATFVDTQTGRAVRIVPRRESRELARRYAPEAKGKWEAQLLGYQRMPDEELFRVRRVALTVSIDQILSRPGAKAICGICGEEIVNEREIMHDGTTLCRACAGQSYYRPALDIPVPATPARPADISIGKAAPAATGVSAPY